MQTYLPYLVSIVVAIISGMASYAAAGKKAKAELNAIKESNKHDLERLMEQHKLDLSALERKHEMEIEKINLEYQHQMALKQTELSNLLGSEVLKEMMRSPEVRKIIAQGVKDSNTVQKKK